MNLLSNVTLIAREIIQRPIWTLCELDNVANGYLSIMIGPLNNTVIFPRRRERVPNPTNDFYFNN